MALAAKNDYIVFARHRFSIGTVDLFKATDGTNWSQPSGWTNLTMGQLSIGCDGTDFWIVHSDSWGAPETTSQPLKYRRITAATDALSGTSAFSDQNGNGVAVPASVSTTKLHCVYRGSTDAPFSVRSDFATITVGASEPKKHILVRSDAVHRASRW